MPSKKPKNVLIMVTNIGSTSLEQNSLEEEPFINKVKHAMKTLIEKKIFMQPKDEIGIITMGDDETRNSEELDNIKMYCENLLVPNWEMIKYINDLSSTTHRSNWIEALHVALCFIRQEVIEPNCRVFLVIFNNFKEDDESISQYDSDYIADDLQSLKNLHLIFVGENVLDEKPDSVNINSLNESEKFALLIMQKTTAQYEQINKFIEARRFYTAPPTASMAWKCTLEWDGILIPCSTYVKVTNTIKLGSWKMKAGNDSQDLLKSTGEIPKIDGDNSSKSANGKNVVKESLRVDAHRNEISAENIINGYKFGGKYIPFSEEDESAMHYSGSIKGLQIYGFVPQSEIKLEYWTGSGSRIIVPTSKEESPAFYSLVQAMAEKQYAAIVRKVYANNNLPKMGILFPKVDYYDIWCLVHLELPFVHDIRIHEKRPIKSLNKVVAKEKLDAMENFINSMTISENEHIYFNPGMFPNIRNQYHWNAVADRAINSDKPLIPLNNYLKEYLTPPEDLTMKAKPHIENLKKLFFSGVVNKDSINVKTEEEIEIVSE